MLLWQILVEIAENMEQANVTTQKLVQDMMHTAVSDNIFQIILKLKKFKLKAYLKRYAFFCLYVLKKTSPEYIYLRKIVNNYTIKNIGGFSYDR